MSSELYPPVPDRALRVLVLLGSDAGPAWLARLLDALEHAPFLDVAFLRVDGAPVVRSPRWAFGLYMRADRLTLGGLAPILAASPLAQAASAPRLPGRRADGGLCLDEPRMAQLREREPDLLLCVGLPVPVPALSGLARHGAWTLEPNCCNPVLCGDWMFKDFQRDRATARSGLRVHTGEGWHLAEPGEVSMARLSLARHRAYQLQKAPAQLLRCLRRLARGETLRLEPLATRTRPDWRGVANLLGSLASRTVRRHGRRLRHAECWSIGVRRAGGPISPDAPSPEGFHELAPPPGWFWADPSPWRHEGRDWVLVEALEYRTGRGEIHALLLDHTLSVERIVPVMRSRHHLSYPFVFGYRDTTWMLVESAQSGAVGLWSCEAFPDRWKQVRELLTGRRVVDATLCHHEGRWWMFACVAESPFDDGGREWNELFAFHADSPLGPWLPHAANPVCTDVRRARPAGPLFVHEGRLIRPGQDCGSEYGRAVVFNEVTRLTPEHYEERPLGVLEPAWRDGLSGCHTYALAHGLMVVDGKFRIPRAQARPSPRHTEPQHAT
ncbi:MAG: glucosamine inositolphosphorylceramide transferase family protein [Lysobacteraceae bacterium]